MLSLNSAANGIGWAYAPVVDIEHFRNANSASAIADETVLMASALKSGSSNLPSLATAQDVREIVRYLRGNPAGVSVIEAMNAEPRRVFDARKIAAYEFWGIIERVDGVLRLTELGTEFANRIEPEKDIHREIIRSVPAYMAVLEWVRDRKSKIITHLDVLKIWQHGNTGNSRKMRDEKLNESVVVSFFSVCHAAELGLATVGKRGQPARFCVASEHLGGFLDEADKKNGGNRTFFHAIRSGHIAEFDYPPQASRLAPIYVSGKDDTSAVQTLRYALEIADFETSTIEGGSFDDQIWPPARIASMQSCQAAVFLLDMNDCVLDATSRPIFHNQRLTEINIAMALFDGRVVLLWNGITDSPIQLDNRNLHFFLADESNGWKIGLDIVRLLKQWRAPNGEALKLN